MKAEEYIERREASLKYVDARKAVELARKEERDKAITALQQVLESWMHGGDSDCVIAEFEELINKE